MIPCYIPSKDRPAQCDLLLTSLEKNAPGLFYPHVYYTGSNEKFYRGYDLLKKKWSHKIPLILETDSDVQFYQWLNFGNWVLGKDSIIGLFADDCIFYKPTKHKENYLRSIFCNDDLFTFTFRLGLNITVGDYVTNSPVNHPKFIDSNDISFTWKYDQYDFWNIFGFTTGFDGYIFRSKDLLDLSEQKEFGNISKWENMICRQFLDKGSPRKSIYAPLHSEVFVQQINTTHNLGHRTTKQFNLTTEEINDKWLDGYSIDLDSMDFNDVNCTHGERSFNFIKS